MYLIFCKAFLFPAGKIQRDYYFPPLNFLIPELPTNDFIWEIALRFSFNKRSFWDKPALATKQKDEPLTYF